MSQMKYEQMQDDMTQNPYIQRQPMPFPATTDQQQMQNTTNVIVIQQPGNTQNSGLWLYPLHGTREWTSGLCNCLDDIGTCCCVFWCPCIVQKENANRMGENTCISCCVPGGDIAIRSKLRHVGGIKGSICNDCCVMTWCPLCALCQMRREMDAMGL